MDIVSLISSKKGKLYLKFLLVVALFAAALYSYSALAAVPSSTPAIANNNVTTANGVFVRSGLEVP